VKRWTVTGRIVLALTLVMASLAAATPAEAITYVPINGRGSTWSKNAIDQWKVNVLANYGMQVEYGGGGSSAGRRDFTEGTVDYAVSEIPFQLKPEDNSAPEKPPYGYAYMPIVAGGTAFMYNLKIGGKQVSNLRLSGETVTKIFTGGITNWNDAAIKADNPGLALPDKKIVPVIRSDGSGSTAQFTLWMSKQHSTLWNAFCKSVGRATPCGLTSQYPNFGNSKAQNGSDGVASYVKENYGEGAITYVEYSYALGAKFPVAKILNAAGYYVEPTANAVAVALLKASINTDKNSTEYLTQILDGVYNNSDPRTYPLSSYSYMIVPTEVGGIFTEAKGVTLSAFASYVLCEGQQQASALGYSPLPMNLVLAGFDQIARIPGSIGKKPDINSCNNPTFKPGDSPSSNQLATNAPQPAACDKQGATQCATGTGGLTAPTTTSSTAATGTEAGTDGTTTELGGELTGGSGSLGSNAVGAPFELAEQGWGAPQSLMLFAGLLLVGVAILPPLLWRRFSSLKKGK